MSASPKITTTQTAAPTDDTMVVTLTVATLREIIRAEIEAAKQTELPRLLYNTAEAAKILGVPRTWLASKARAGDIKVTRLGHYVLFALDDLREFARQRNDRR